MSPLLVAIFFCVLSSAVYTQNPYCSISFCSNKVGGMTSNTLCKFTNTTFGSLCAPSYSASVSSDDIDNILNVHNDYRRRVAKGLETRGNPGPQPTASNMRQLVWDSELADMAQTHAQQCLFAHDTCRDVTRFRVGQNIYVGMSTAITIRTNWTAAITAWYDEVAAITPEAQARYPSSFPAVIGHYTQVVWANSYTVGCGISFYQDVSGAGNLPTRFPYKKLYVCNYGPAGNFINQTAYLTGDPASACPTGTTANDGLCA